MENPRTPEATNAVDRGGYAHRAYAQALGEYGTPRPLASCGGWILEREISDTKARDAMGCYPLFSCADWSALPADLTALQGALVSVSLVPDPFGDYTPELLRECFPDVCIRFKSHFVVDLECAPETFVASAHRRNVRKGLANVTVERCENPARYLDDWTRLYGNLCERHEITGITAFSRSSFAGQFQVPGLVAFRAECDGASVGMVLWMRQGEVATYHLAAYDDVGYGARASFALFWRSIEYFRAQGLRWLNLQGAAGLNPKPDDGLARFKTGWSTGTRTAYFCGRVLSRDPYDDLVRRCGRSGSRYFPIYRRGEFV